MIVVALTLALIDSGENHEGIGTVRFPIFPPETLSTVHIISVSPDGKKIVFEGHDDTVWSLWMRELDSPRAQRLDGTEGHAGHFWSPDSRSIGFFADGELKKIHLSGGPAISLADAASFAGGGTWNREGTILFAAHSRGPIYRVSATGGEATAITQLDQSRQEMSHRYPYFLPDGRHFLYVIVSKLSEQEGIYLGSLDSSERRLLSDTLGNQRSTPLLVWRMPHLAICSSFANGHSWPNPLTSITWKLQANPFRSLNKWEVTDPSPFQRMAFWCIRVLP